MKDRFYLLASLLLFSLTAFSQVTVSGTVTDTPDGSVWANGTWSAAFVPDGACSFAPSPAYFSGNLSSVGGYSFSAPRNAQCLGGQTFAITACPKAGNPSAASCAAPVNFFVPGPTGTATKNLTPASPRFNYAAGSYGYSTNELQSGVISGSSFFLTSINTFTCYSSSWSPANCPGGSGSPSLQSITAWGDSLGQWEGISGMSFPVSLSLQSGRKVYDRSVSGATSTQVAIQMNAYAGTSTQSISAPASIPTSGSVNLTFGVNPLDGSESFPTTITIGGVTGTLSYVSTSVSAFTPASYPSSSLPLSTGTQYTVTPSAPLSGCNTLWMGRNNYTAPTQVLADFAAAVTAIQKAGSSCYVVPSIINAEYEPSGSPNYNTLIALNNSLAAAYPNNYFDLRAILVSLYDPNNPADVLDHTNDIPPYSLRAGNRPLTTLGAAVTSTSQTSFTTSACFGQGIIWQIGGELVYQSSACSGTGPYTWTGTRGYASTVAATYPNGAIIIGVDSLHLGNNPYTVANPYCVNGYTCVAEAMYRALGSIGAEVTPTNFQYIQSGTKTGIWTAYLYANGYGYQLGQSSYWISPKSNVISHVFINMPNGASSCTVQPIIGIFDATTNLYLVSVTIPNGYGIVDSGNLYVGTRAGDELQIVWQSTGTGCVGTTPAQMQVSVSFSY